MSETEVWRAVITVTNTKSEIHDTVEHFRSANYGAASSHLTWLSAPENGATATLQDNCPRDGHVLIHLHALIPVGYSLVIQAIQREVSATRPENAPGVRTYALALHQTLRQTLSLLTEQFTIPDTLDNFVMWVNEYGYRRQSHYIPHHPERKRDGGFQLLHSTVSPDNISVGELIFHVELNPDVVAPSFTATAEPYSGLNPVRSEVLDYLREIAAAIRERWAETTKEERRSTLPDSIQLLPAEPSADWHIEDIFDWYHRGGIVFVPSIAKLAKYLNVTPEHLHNLHSPYMKAHPSGRKPDSKSQFAGMYIRVPPTE